MLLEARNLVKKQSLFGCIPLEYCCSLCTCLSTIVFSSVAICVTAAVHARGHNIVYTGCRIICTRSRSRRRRYIISNNIPGIISNIIKKTEYSYCVVHYSSHLTNKATIIIIIININISYIFLWRILYHTIPNKTSETPTYLHVLPAVVRFTPTCK